MRLTATLLAALSVGGAAAPHNGMLALSVVSPTEVTSNVYLVDASGKWLHALTRGDDDWNGNPAWSPTGDRIAFVSSRSAAGSPAIGDLYIMDAAGKHVRELTFSDDVIDFTPSWSPDGTRIAFSGGSSLYVVNADGTGRHLLVAGPGQVSMPAWSPDGTRIAFVRFSTAGTGAASIWTVAADGSDPQQLTPLAAYHDWSPNWSPDGTQIAFDSDRGGDWDIWVMNADGSNSRDLTDHPAEDRSPVWSPNGRRIAFSSDRANKGHLDVYVMDASGGHVRRVTHRLGRFAYATSWQRIP
jgi:Tol biopolymer transport system component